MKRLLFTLMAVLSVGCSDMMDYWDLMFENGLIIRGGGEPGDSMPFYKLSGGTLMKPPLSQDVQESLRFFVGENEIRLLEIDPQQLESLGMAVVEEYDGNVRLGAIYQNGQLDFDLDNNGEVVMFSYVGRDYAGDLRANSTEIRFSYSGKPPIQLPMTEEEIREYFGEEYSKMGSIGWDL